ncbi:MAG: glycosyl hydrolase, partial [Nonlabens ulvanivorans]
MIAMSKDMKKKFSEVEKALYQTKNRSGQDPLNFPIRLTNKLAHLNSLAQIGDFAPTSQSIEVKDELTAEIEKQLAIFDQVLQSDIKKFNEQFNALNLEYLVIEKEKK